MKLEYVQIERYLGKLLEYCFRNNFKDFSNFNTILQKLSVNLVECVTKTPEVAREYVKDLKLPYYLPYHSVNTAVVALSAGHCLGFNKEQLIDTCRGALLHDAGMVHVPEKVFNSKEKLDISDLFIVQQHPEYGINILSEENKNVKTIIKSHHEKFCGGGYPMGGTWRINGNTLSAVVSMADAFDAMVTHRVYKNSITPDEARINILSESGISFHKDNVVGFMKGLNRLNY